MKIYRVIPMAGTEFKTQRQALVSLENGHYWLCTGWVQVHGGAAEKSVEFEHPIRVRTDSSKLDCSSLKADGWLVKWKAGQRAFVQYTRKPAPPPPARVDNSVNAVPAPAPRLVRDYKADKILLRKEFKKFGFWMTSGNMWFRPFYVNEDIGVGNFPLVVWDRLAFLKGPPEFDPDPNCRKAGDRELERWYTASKVSGYNPYAKRLATQAGGGGFNTVDGNTRAVPAPDPDQITDSHVSLGERTGHMVGTTGHFVQRN